MRSDGVRFPGTLKGSHTVEQLDCDSPGTKHPKLTVVLKASSKPF